jgi:outer membrane protein
VHGGHEKDLRLKPAAALCACLAALLPWNSPAAAQDEDAPRRTRVGLGAQFVPSYPGSDSHNIIPLFDFSRARGDEPFGFEAPDESFGFSLVDEGGFEFGPALNFQGSRKAADVGAALDKVDATIEAGAFAQYAFSPSFRARVEARRGIGGHEGWTGTAGADFIARDEDNYLFSIGPRVTWSDARYHRAYFGVTAAEATRTGLAAFAPRSGVQAIGATSSFLTQLSKRWGIYSYAKYDRLVGDASRSPVVRKHGARNQFSGGLALTYTFGKD